MPFAVAGQSPSPKASPDSDPRSSRVMEQQQRGASRTRAHRGEAKKTTGASAGKRVAEDPATGTVARSGVRGGANSAVLSTQAQAKVGEAHAPVPGGGATPGVGAGIDLIFMIDLPKKDFIKDLTKYIKTTLQAQEFHEVNNLDDVFAYLSQLGQKGQKVRRIRLVSHGLVTGKVATINQEHTAAWWIGPKELNHYAQRQDVKAIIRQVMTPGAVVEFWGCNIGRSHEAGQAWANLFRSTFRATTGTFRTGWHWFSRPATKHERGISVPGRPGKWVEVRNTSEIDRFAGTEIVLNGRPYTLMEAFLSWLLEVYEDLVKNGDILPVDETGGERQAKINKLKFMVPLFNRSDGDIRYIEVTARTDPKGKHPIRPGDQNEWREVWVTFPPLEMSDAAEGKSPHGAVDKPALPAHPPAPPTPAQPSKATQPEHLRSVPGAKPPARPHAGATAGDPVRHTDSTPSGPSFGHVWFASDHGDVVGKGHLEVARFVASLGADSSQNIRLDGYASTDGPEDYNLQLSGRRARAVKNELVKSYGIPENHIEMYAHGETSEFSATSRSKNRVVILSSRGPTTKAVTPPGVPIPGTPTHAKAPTQAAEPEQAAKPDDPHLLLSGRATAAAVAKILPTAHTIVVSSSMGYVELKPGTVWDNDKMLIYASPMRVYYTVGHNLYESSTSNFLRSYWFDALARGAQRAKIMIVLAKAEIALLEGIFVPWYLMALMSVAKVALFYHFHKQAVDEAIHRLPGIIEKVRDFHDRYPVLFNRLALTIGKELLLDFPKGIDAEDVAFFIGRVIRGVFGIKGIVPVVTETIEITIGKLIFVFGEVALLVTLLHSPFILTRGIEETVKDRAGELRARMAANGVAVSEEEARVLLRELLIHPDSEKRLQIIQAAMAELLPVMKELEKALKDEF